MLLLGDSILEYSYTHEGRNILVIGACFKPKSPFKAGDYFCPLSVSNIFFFFFFFLYWENSQEGNQSRDSFLGGRDESSELS